MPKRQHQQTRSLRPVLHTLIDSAMLYRIAFPLWIGISSWLLIPFVASVVSTIAAPLIPQPVETLLNIFIIATTAIIGIWVVVMIILASAKAYENKPLDQKQFSKESWLIVWRLFVASLIKGALVLGGALLFIIPGIILSIQFAFTELRVVIEKESPLQALSSSRELVRGKFWSVAWRVVAGLLIIAAIQTTIMIMFFGIGLNITGESGVSIAANPPLWSDIISTLLDVIFVPLYALYMTNLYFEIKKIKK